MEPGPSTVRADSQLEPLAERMRRQDLTSLPVTTPEGELLGVVHSKPRSRQGSLDAEGSSGVP
jgi:Mg/Co/Ni transporter MgtE